MSDWPISRGARINLVLDLTERVLGHRDPHFVLRMFDVLGSKEPPSHALDFHLCKERIMAASFRDVLELAEYLGVEAPDVREAEEPLFLQGHPTFAMADVALAELGELTVQLSDLVRQLRTEADSSPAHSPELEFDATAIERVVLPEVEDAISELSSERGFPEDLVTPETTESARERRGLFRRLGGRLYDSRSSSLVSAVANVLKVFLEVAS